MKPFARINLFSAALRRGILVSSLAFAAKHGHNNLVLGAWGCGAFGNKPRVVAGLFRQALVEDGFGGMFDEVCFAIRGRTDDAKFLAFKDLKCAEGGISR